MELISKSVGTAYEGTPRSTVYTRTIKWFLDHYVLFSRTPIEPHLQGQLLIPGKIYTFRYNPKHKDKLSFYDNQPMNLILGHLPGTSANGMNAYGINLSFMPPKVRIKILDQIVIQFERWIDENREKISDIDNLWLETPDQTRIPVGWEICKKILEGSGFEHAIRSYIYERMESPPLIITYNEWYRTCLAPSQFIEKMNVIAIYARYAKLANPNFNVTGTTVKKVLKPNNKLPDRFSW